MKSYHRQRGFALIQLAIYAGIFLAVAGVIGAAYHTIKKSGADEIRVELEPKLASCQADIKRQNDAVAALAAESARKAKEASKALAAAKSKGKVWEDNATRLMDVLKRRKPDGPTDCKTAWSEIRGQK